MPKATKPTTKKPRVREVPRHQSFRLTKTKLRQAKPLPSAGVLLKKTYGIIRSDMRIFGGIALIYSVFTVVVIQGFSSAFNISEFKKQLQELFGDAGNIETSLALYGYLLGSAGSQAGESASSYQFMVGCIVSLATIWGVRQLLAGEKPGLRDVFYKGMYPLIPFLLVLFVIVLQLLPLAIGSFIYSTVIGQGLAVTAIEKFLWLLLFIALTLLSLYMLASSLFALYIVTLPDMTPVRALRSARDLVLHRRFGVMIRILAFPLVVLLVSLIIFIPLLMVAAVAAQVLFLVVSALSLIGFNIYMYNLYRGLL